eukprot:scaffold2429_cov165-Amphora_coffeaeformis.AAC.7
MQNRLQLGIVFVRFPLGEVSFVFAVRVGELELALEMKKSEKASMDFEPWQIVVNSVLTELHHATHLGKNCQGICHIVVRIRLVVVVVASGLGPRRKRLVGPTSDECSDRGEQASLRASEAEMEAVKEADNMMVDIFFVGLLLLL